MSAVTDRDQADEDLANDLIGAASYLARELPGIVASQFLDIAQRAAARLRTLAEEKQAAEELLAWFAGRAPHEYECMGEACVCGLDEKQEAVASHFAARARQGPSDA